MKPLSFIFSFIIICCVIILIGCSGKEPEQKTAPKEKSFRQGEAEATSESVAGLEWTIPADWKKEQPKTMRIANYTIPAVEGDNEDGECAVFYFGKDQGGSIDANIARWVSQFANAGIPAKSLKQINNLSVTLVEIKGTYLAVGGNMMQSQTRKENYKLLGAIVEGKEGLVFFKCTGPKKTISSKKTEFDSLVLSIKNRTQ